MKIRSILFFVLIMILNNGFSQINLTVDSVDLSRYSGLWYEIASSHPDVENDCHCTTEEYEFIPGRKFIQITTKCIRFNKGRSVVSVNKIKAFPCRNANNTKFRLQSMWLLRNDYSIIGLDAGYNWAIILVPSRETVYILSRDSFIPTHQFNEILNIIRNKGYNIKAFEKIPQNCDIIE